MRSAPLLAATLLFAMVAQRARGDEPVRPNVLVILADDLGWGDLGCYGNRSVATPRLDELARGGARFTRYYSASPICSASRCGVLTGQYPARWRISSYLQSKAGNRACDQADFLDPSAPSLPRAFHAAGYATAHVGKWHLGGGRDVTEAPKFAAYGYDLGLGTYESPEPAPPLGRTTTPWEKRLEPGQVPRYDRTRWMVDEALAFFDANRERPCFVNLWLDDIHTPFRPSPAQQAAVPEHEGEPPNQAAYRAVLHELDREMGRLLDGLKRRGLDDRTVIVFAGDNGPEPSFGRARAGGLRGMKWSLYEGGIREPLIVRWPGQIPAGTVDETTVFSAVDLFPTLCTLCRVALPQGPSFDGLDLAPAMRGQPRQRATPLFWEYGRKPPPADAKGLAPFPYPKEAGSQSPNLAVLDGRWKLLVNDNGRGAELYNLGDDPLESHNVAADQPERTRRLTDQVLKWRRAMP